MKKLLLLSVCCFMATLSALPFYSTGPRNSINLAGEWQAAHANELNIKKVPQGLSWKTTMLPTVADGKNNFLPNSATQTPYPPVSATYLNSDKKSFKITERQSAWYKKSVEIPAEALKNHAVYLYVGSAAYRSSYWVNGKFVTESIQSLIPQNINITKYLKAGKNEIMIALTAREGIIDVENLTYIAPSGGVSLGIHNSIRLDFRPDVAVDDVFVRTTVAKPQISFELTIENNSSSNQVVTPFVTIKSQQDSSIIHTTITGTPVEVAAGKTAKTIVKSNWKAPTLWSIHSPIMYDADIVLSKNNLVVDRIIQGFGYREFKIKGRDFLLNGERIVLLRGSTLRGINSEMFAPTWDNAGELNTNRLHLGFNFQNYIRVGDEQGQMIVPESGWWHVTKFPSDKSHIWLPGVVEYYKGWVKQLRNHPSIVMWSMANETYWNRTQANEMTVAKKLVETVRELDDTRPLQGDAEITWGNLLDIICIHYPEENAGEINMTYQNAGMNVPNDTWYLRKGKGIKSWRAEFDWDRPLVIGEYFCNEEGQLPSYSSFMGDTVFDGEKWEKQRLTGLGKHNTDDVMDNLFVETLKKYTTEYRVIGVAGMNIWTGEKAAFMPRQVVRPYDFHPNAEAGKSFKREVVVINDQNIPIVKLKAFLTIDGTTVWKSEYKIHVSSGEAKKMTLDIPMPLVDKNTEAKLLVAAFTHTNPIYLPYEVSRYNEKVYIVPDENLNDLTSKIAVLGDSKKLDKVLNLYNISKYSKEIVESTKLAIVATNKLEKSMTESLNELVKKGGNVLILPQENWQPFLLEFPTRDKDHAATQAWLRTASHPMMEGMSAGQFSFWKPNNIVSIGTFKKPQEGAFSIPLDCGGRFGLCWSPLVEVPIESGAYILTTFDLENAATADAGAKKLLANIIKYGCSREPKVTETLNVLNKDNKDLIEILGLSGANVNFGTGESGAILVDASAEITADDKKALTDALAAGRTVWLHDFTPKTIDKVAHLFPFKSNLIERPKEISGAVIRSNDLLMSGLANFDFFWYRGSWVHEQYRNNSVRHAIVAQSGDWILDAPYSSDVERLLAPAFFTKIKVGEGTILFDTLQWEHALASETEKVLRMVSLLINNMGGSFKSKSQKHYDRTFVNLKKFANMGYYDRVEDDGKGGWTDQGSNDMRLFLINHTGRANGSDDGMEVPVEAFPTKVDFNGVLYELIDPKSNNNKSVVSLGSSQHGVKLPQSAGPFAVGAKAEIIWFLHAASWTGAAGSTIAEYTLTYDDNTTVKIPIRKDIEVGDWHNPIGYSAAKVAWSGANLFTNRTGIWTFAWQNLHPEKVIKSITLKGGLSQAQYVLLAIACGVESSGETVLAKWDFEKEDYISKLYFSSSKSPEKTESGYRYGADAYASARLKDTTVAENMTAPYSLAISFTAEGKPDGYQSGIVQMFEYLKKGFRVVLNKDLHVSVELNVGEAQPRYIRSKSPIELNKRVNFEVKFDGKKAIMLLNGNIEALIDCPYPVVYNSDVVFGRASGNNYHFNGIIHEVSFKKN